MHQPARRAAPEPGRAPALVEAGARALRGRGEPAPPGVAPAHARVHDDPLAHALSAAVGAHAVTTGADIALRGTDASRSPAVLAHEAAHVVQQGGTPASGPLAPTRPGDDAEREVTGGGR